MSEVAGDRIVASAGESAAGGEAKRMASGDEQVAERLVVIRNPHGLHMRPAVKFVDCASSYLGQVSLVKGPQEVDGKSIMQLTLLRATQGTELKLVVSGEGAEAAAEALAAILEAQEPEDLEGLPETI